MPSATPKKRNKALLAALVALGTAAALYFSFAAWLWIDGRFPFRTTLNGQDVSLQRALNVQRVCMEDYYPNMSFSIDARGALPYAVTPSSFDFSDASRAVDFLPESTLTWPLSLFRESDFRTTDGGAIEKLARRIESDAPAFRQEDWQAAQNAYPAYDEKSGRFVIVPDTKGTEIDEDKFESALERHVLIGKGDLDLNAAGVYLPAEVAIYSPALTDTCERLNRFLAAEVVYAEGETTKIFSAQALLPYLTVDRATSAVVYDAAAAAADGVFDAFAAELAEAFDSKGVQRDFVTHDGSVVPVRERTWRSKLDPAATAAALAALTFDDLSSGEPIAGEFVWEKAALDQLKNYVEVDLTNQTLYLYTDGELVLETPIVSGDVATRHTTPGGAFSLIGKHRNVTLRGPDYASFVRYWMPFNNRIGLHDASWRRRFGGTIYRTNGSHGCVNMPGQAAQQVYETIDAGYAIVCYWRPAAQ